MRAQLEDELALGEGGLGLDSIEIAEVLLACEERCGIEVNEALFGELPVTIRGMADGFAVALA